MGYAPAARWSAYASVVDAAILSFSQLTDRSILDVQPLRLDVVTISEPTSITSFHQRNGPAISVEDLAALNRTSAGAVQPAGSMIKTVVGTPVN
jgi:predicted Zn-dependent protease